MEQENKCYGCLLGKVLDLPSDANVTITKHSSTDKATNDGSGVCINIYVVRNYSVINKTTIPDDPDTPVDNTTGRSENVTVYGHIANESI